MYRNDGSDNKSWFKRDITLFINANYDFATGTFKPKVEMKWEQTYAPVCRCSLRPVQAKKDNKHEQRQQTAGWQDYV